jgi:hypothetical protein
VFERNSVAAEIVTDLKKYSTTITSTLLEPSSYITRIHENYFQKTPQKIIFGKQISKLEKILHSLAMVVSETY